MGLRDTVVESINDETLQEALCAMWGTEHPGSDLDEAIARLVEMGKCSAVITQNVDNLHQNAGVPDDQVIELVGSACDTLKTGDVTFSAEFPCGSVVVE